MLQSLLIVVILWQPLRGMGFVDVEWVVLCCHLNLNTTEDHTTVFRLTPPVFNPTTSSTPGLSCYVTVPNVTLTCVDPITITCADGAHCFELDAGVVSFTVYGPCTFRGMFLKSMSNRTNTTVSLSGGIRVEGTGSETSSAVRLVNIASLELKDVWVQSFSQGCVHTSNVTYSITIRNVFITNCSCHSATNSAGLFVFSLGPIVVDNVTVFTASTQSNAEVFGGCATFDSTDITIKNSKFQNCSLKAAKAVGGCAYIIGNRYGSIYLASSVFEDCSSSFSAGAFNLNARFITVENVVTSNSSAAVLAGGIQVVRQNFDSTITFRNVTVTHPQASGQDDCVLLSITPKSYDMILTFTIWLKQIVCTLKNGTRFILKNVRRTLSNGVAMKGLVSNFDLRENYTRTQTFSLTQSMTVSRRNTEILNITSKQNQTYEVSAVQKVVSSVVQIGTLLSTDGTTSYTTQLIP
eukprot:PhF_6_TR25334/c0_g1_i3/m.35024